MINIDFDSVLGLIKAFPNEQSCINHLEQLRWSGTVISPFDHTSKVYICKDNKYRCRNTGKYFNVCTKTLFDNTKIDLQKWFVGIFLVTSHKKGISSIQLGKDLGITQKTAWFMLQRIRNCFGIDGSSELSGTIESDETFVGGKNKNRHKDKKVKNSQGRSFKDKTPVLGLLERKVDKIIERPHKIIIDKIVKEIFVLKPSFVICRVIPDTTSKSVQPILKSFVKQGSKLISDEWWAYDGLNSEYEHHIVNHKAKEYVNPNDSSITSNSIEGFWSILKRGIIGIYHKTSKKHLQKYADEFTFRYNTRHVSTSERINILLSNLEHRLTYKTLIAK